MITDLQRRDYLASMGIQVWVPNSTTATVPLPDATSSIDTVARDCDWPGLKHQVSKCTRCDLHRGRTQTVFGVGNERPKWLIVGEAPGADEDKQGEPFVGRAGQLLNAMLKAAGFDRDEVYITNIVKCRPPNNRNPRVEEAQACSSFLSRQIEFLSPKLILAVGRVAAHNLLDSDLALGRLRGITHRYGPENIPVVVTYHPAYLLRQPGEKQKVWTDLCFALSMGEELAF